MEQRPLAMISTNNWVYYFVLISWIYDINPEEGKVKTEPVDKVKSVEGTEE